jgi:hypothetical protein
MNNKKRGCDNDYITSNPYLDKAKDENTSIYSKTTLTSQGKHKRIIISDDIRINTTDKS